MITTFFSTVMPSIIILFTRSEFCYRHLKVIFLFLKTDNTHTQKLPHLSFIPLLGSRWVFSVIFEFDLIVLLVAQFNTEINRRIR